MSAHVNEKNLEEVISKIMKIINKTGMNIPELLVMYGNLGYHIGASMAGLAGSDGPNLEQLKQMYYQQPTVDVALMIQGLQTTSWEEDYIKHPQLSNLKED